MKKLRTFFALAVLALLATNCNNKSEEYIDPRGTDYAGSESCIQCHQAQYEMASHSSHFKATSLPTKENILGDFSQGNHVFIYDKNTKLVMEQRNDSLYQVLYKNGKEVEAHPFDILFGTKHAQTSAYWNNHFAYELPVSFYKSLNNWATSPGYSATQVNFNRKIEKECFACHSSNIGSRYITTSSDSITFMSMDVEDFMNKKTLVYGIDCERCHGPAKKHAAFHLKFPDVKKAQNIVAIKSLSRQQKLDACAICHSGNDKLKIKSRFEFRPGDNLLDYFRGVPNANDTTHYDVHGNQMRLLTQSKCFIKSDKMDCITCHNPHQNASPNLASYAKICMSCHQGIQHNATTLKTMSGSLLAANCVECHMPKKSSNAITFQPSNSKELSNYILRTHKIGIYPSAKK
ncbi:cytochrome c3 family protein [Flavobacterium sp. Fl-77]|uniref:Cytochrome c3 family protein n=1 Tax=Flavobacterium flavipigmentatum TaxID=2893884 RepID=A0AAJ2SCD7_9FLAO|nr:MULTISPECIES: cytochrome c3 family protein [unclassified Flavobacterium]MDX6180620.1 cytochrome c3 family protein [Flavobacterium sp. Fl-33]MDX6184220.1 cytochrome c3 family protein [Flavobacterium sp. Fl-77]UFH39332.1 cytochrome c3 family protein [Flavobacterium sp. F-70]